MPVFTGSCVRERKKERGEDKGGAACTGGYKEVHAVRPRAVAGEGGYDVMEFGMYRRIKPKKICVHISVKEIWHNLEGLPKKNSGATKCFGFSGPKVA